MEKQKILITGATGFIGNHLIQYLLGLGHDIIATGIEEPAALTQSWKSKVTYIKADLNQHIEDPFALFGCPDKVIHLAWQGLPNYKELFHLEKNLFNSYFLLKTLVCNGLKDLTVLGTCFEYGLAEGELVEDSNVTPVTPYGLAKDCLRKFLQELRKHQNFNFKWIRLFYLYGEGQSKKSILELIKNAVQNKEETFNMSGGEQVRDYLPVEKVAEYIAKIAMQSKIQGIVNCCSGQPIKLKDFVKNYLAQNNMDIKLNFGYYPYLDYEPMAFWGNRNKLNSILGGESES
jgi:dTDP-6-deoxy-L-talose 4-dehydrogenase (NAD+)